VDVYAFWQVGHWFLISCRCRGLASPPPTIAMTGLDPVTHRGTVLEWVAGSSPAVTMERGKET
jgi:hypothetical protein